MIRHNQWKYIYYPGYPPQLFDLKNDPTERHDLGQNHEYAQIIAECHVELSRIDDPDAANLQAFDKALQYARRLKGRLKQPGTAEEFEI